MVIILARLKEGKLRRAAILFFILSVGQSLAGQKAPEYESVTMKILRIERSQEDLGNGALWLTVKITTRDTEGITYKAKSRCISTNAESPASCSRLVLPRIGKTVVAKVYPQVGLIYFSDSAIGFVSFEIETEEVSQ